MSRIQKLFTYALIGLVFVLMVALAAVQPPRDFVRNCAMYNNSDLRCVDLTYTPTAVSQK